MEKKDRIILPLTSPEREVLTYIAEEFGCSEYTIIGQCKAMEAVYPRWLFWLYLYNEGYNLNQCGQKTGGHGHSTVLTGFGKMEVELMQNRIFTKGYNRICINYKLRAYEEIKSSFKFRIERRIREQLYATAS